MTLRRRAMSEAPSATRSLPSFTLPSWLVVADKALAKDRSALQRQRIRYIVNCTPPLTEGGVANYFASAFEYHRVPIRDVATENLLPALPAVVEFLQRARVRADGRVLIHCNEGKSRSAAIAAGFLIVAYGQTAADALAAVRAARPIALPKEAFAKQLSTLTPATLHAEVDGFVEEEEVAAGPPARPAIGPSIGPSLGPSIPSMSTAKIGPSVGPAPRPTIGPAVGPAPRAAAIVGPSRPPRTEEEELLEQPDTEQRPAKRPKAGPASGPALPRTDQSVK